MKKALLFGTAFAVLFCLGGLPLMAQGRGGGGMGMGREPGTEAGLNRGTNTRTPMETRKTPSQILKQNTTLSSKVQDLLPAGTNVQEAASGFKNLNEFVAVVHVSHNLNIPFDQLKGKVNNGDSLGKAVQSLDPNLSHKQVKTEIKKGKHQAKEDIKASHRP